MTVKTIHMNQRRGDPYQDQRSGEDRRQVHLLSYFSNGGFENRNAKERRGPAERRKGCVRVSRWSSVCVDALSDRIEDEQA